MESKSQARKRKLLVARDENYDRRAQNELTMELKLRHA
jgi:hypothetical protein